MPPTLQVRTLYSSPLVAIDDVCCRPTDGTCGRDEIVRRPGIAFVRAGVFVKHVGRRRVLADPNHVVFFRPGHDYRVSHPDVTGDDCTAFTFDPEMVREAAPFPRQAPPPLSALTDARTIGLQHGIRRLAFAGSADPLELDELCLRLLRQVLAPLSSADRPARPVMFHGRPPAGPTSARHRRLADRARELLATRYTEAWTLTAVAATVGCSPFHLSRVFHRHAGLPLHRYLRRLRLRAALDRLSDPGQSLAAIAHELGFASHGHFTAGFAREFGVAPSVARRRPLALARPSKNLEA